MRVQLEKIADGQKIEIPYLLYSKYTTDVTNYSIPNILFTFISILLISQIVLSMLVDKEQTGETAYEIAEDYQRKEAAGGQKSQPR